jgi:hypothetical protein
LIDQGASRALFQIVPIGGKRIDFIKKKDGRDVSPGGVK